MELESILPQGSLTLWVCQELFWFLLSKVFDIFGFILYWYDISSDILLAIKFKDNCQQAYLNISIILICNSLYQSICMSADLYRISKMTANERKKSRTFKCLWSSWFATKGYCKGYIHGLFFPIQLIRLSFKLLIYGNEGMTEQEKLHLFAIKFTEGFMESMPQLMLSFYVILQHGLNNWVQVASILGSSLSLLYSFSMKHAYLKHLHYPTKKEIFIAGLNNIIPMILFNVGQLVGMAIVISRIKDIVIVVITMLYFILIITMLQMYDIKYHSIKKFINFFTCSMTGLIFFCVITVSHSEKTIMQNSSIFANSTWLQHIEKNETNITYAFLTPFQNCPNATKEHDFEVYQNEHR